MANTDTWYLWVISLLTSIRHATLLDWSYDHSINKTTVRILSYTPLCWSHNNMSITLCNESIFASASQFISCFWINLQQLFSLSPLQYSGQYYLSTPALIKPARINIEIYCSPNILTLSWHFSPVFLALDSFRDCQKTTVVRWCFAFAKKTPKTRVIFWQSLNLFFFWRHSRVHVQWPWPWSVHSCHEAVTSVMRSDTSPAPLSHSVTLSGQ